MIHEIAFERKFNAAQETSQCGSTSTVLVAFQFILEFKFFKRNQVSLHKITSFPNLWGCNFAFYISKWIKKKIFIFRPLPMETAFHHRFNDTTFLLHIYNLTWKNPTDQPNKVNLFKVHNLLSHIGKDSPHDGDESSNVFVPGRRPEPSPRCCLSNEQNQKRSKMQMSILKAK